MAATGVSLRFPICCLRSCGCWLLWELEFEQCVAYYGFRNGRAIPLAPGESSEFEVTSTDGRSRTRAAEVDPLDRDSRDREGKEFFFAGAVGSQTFAGVGSVWEQSSNFLNVEPRRKSKSSASGSVRCAGRR